MLCLLLLISNLHLFNPHLNNVLYPNKRGNLPYLNLPNTQLYPNHRNLPYLKLINTQLYLNQGKCLHYLNLLNNLLYLNLPNN